MQPYWISPQSNKLPFLNIVLFDSFTQAVYVKKKQICNSIPSTKQITASSTSQPPFSRHIDFTITKYGDDQIHGFIRLHDLKTHAKTPKLFL